MAITKAKVPAAKAGAVKADPKAALAAHVDASMVRRAIEFASTNDIRYHLNGVWIQPSKSGGVLVMASDGHTALVLHDPNGKADKPYILPFNKTKHARALSEKGAANVTVSDKGRVAVTDFADTTLFIHPGELIDAKFPDLSAVMAGIGDYEMGLKGAFNPEYMRRALDSAGKRKYAGICFYSRKSDGDTASSLFTTPNGFGLLMPMRGEPELGKKLTKDFGGII